MDAVAKKPKLSAMDADVEKTAGDCAQLTNTSVRGFSWDGITVSVKDRVTKKPKILLQSINGFIEAGKMLAIMGPRCVKR